MSWLPLRVVVVLAGALSYALLGGENLMASAFPGGLDAWPTTHQDNVGESVKALDINNLADSINKIETILGINPQQGGLPAGKFANVVSRLDAIDLVQFKTISALPYTLILGDLGMQLENASVAAGNVALPGNAALAWPVGGSVTFRQTQGAGAITFVGDASSSVRSYNNAVTTPGDFAFVTAIKVALNVWSLAGNLA